VDFNCEAVVVVVGGLAVADAIVDADAVVDAVVNSNVDCIFVLFFFSSLFEFDVKELIND
jgi:hypothetical protein